MNNSFIQNQYKEIDTLPTRILWHISLSAEQ